ncbi:hypothetical protein AURDEDRAFT_170528 [Auricularia subglabra TFB-10046 SS5]|nr:hypothetical protein AURDEDRAFT_170528 [Auricularia subglabra TFB-10046 SS5]
MPAYAKRSRADGSRPSTPELDSASTRTDSSYGPDSPASKRSRGTPKSYYGRSVALYALARPSARTLTQSSSYVPDRADDLQTAYHLIEEPDSSKQPHMMPADLDAVKGT